MANDELSWWKILIPFTRHGYGIYIKLLLAAVLIFLSPYLEAWNIQWLNTTVTILFTYLFLNILFNYARSILIKLYLKKHNYQINHYDNYVVGITRISWFLNHLLFLLILLQIIGINIMNILTGLSLVAVALVLIFRDYISNFLNSIIIMFSKNIRLNENVKIGDYKGKIKDISFMNIELHTHTGEVVYIPNSQVLTKEIVNYSKNKSKKILVEFTLTSLNSKQIKKLETELKKKVGKIAGKKKISSYLEISKIEKDVINFSFIVETNNYDYEFEKEVKDLSNKIIIDFKKK